MAALRWKPTHVTKPDPRVSPLTDCLNVKDRMAVMGINRFDHETKVKARSER